MELGLNRRTKTGGKESVANKEGRRSTLGREKNQRPTMGEFKANTCAKEKEGGRKRINISVRGKQKENVFESVAQLR